MGKEKKKFESGAATAFIPRNKAIKKLQLTLADFRRLCILKGIYPVEPKNKKKVNKGSTANRTFYYAKDINFLAHEPIINKFRDFKVYVKRLKRARGRRDIKAVGRIRNNKPSYKIDHIVKERYPTFTDALRDLDDCLSLIFLFSSLPKSKRVYVERVHLCKRFMLEFMHYVILSKSLRKCFISIKGYYFQADIKGQKVTWIMPHKLSYQTPDDVDFRIMSTFVEFYSIMLGFINFKSYQDLGLIYPPKLAISATATAKKEEEDNDYNDEHLASLNCDFVKIPDNLNADNEENGDEFAATSTEGNTDLLERAQLEAENLKKLKTLFKGLKFFLNREVPREPFVFAVKAFSGQVSWDKTTGLGSTYQEDDTTITHHIIDRPVTGKMYINRVYVQPQWVFDCINENMLLTVDDYLPGAILPPHLSPFVEIKEGDYVPPEKQRLIKMKLGINEDSSNTKYINPNEYKDIIAKDDEKKETSNANKKETKKTNNNKKKTREVPKKEEREEDDDEDEDKEAKDDDDDEEEEGDDEFVNGMKVDIDSPDEDANDETEEEKFSDDDESSKPKRNKKKPIIGVSRGQVEVENLAAKLKKQMDEEKKLTEMTIPKKNKRLYNKIMHSRKKTKQENEKLKEKRQIYEESMLKKIHSKKAAKTMS